MIFPHYHFLKLHSLDSKMAIEKKRKDDPLKEYREKEAMTLAKEKEHEPTAVKREMTENITEPGQTGTNPEEAAEIARKKGMAKGTAGAAEQAVNMSKEPQVQTNK
jgi:hypothetical protein